MRILFRWGGGRRFADFTGRQFRGDWRRFSSRHNKGGMVLFADGHVAPFSLREVITPGTITPAADWNKPASMIWNTVGPGIDGLMNS